MMRILALGLLILTIHSLRGNIFSVAEGQAQSAKIKAVDWSPNDEYIAVGSENGISIYDAELDEITFLDVAFNNPLSWSPDGNSLAFFHSDYDEQAGFHRVFLEIWNMSQADYTISAFEVAIAGQIAWSPDGSKIAVGAFAVEQLPNDSEVISDELIQIIDIPTGEVVDTLDSELFVDIQSLSWSPDGRYLAAAEVEDFIILWDMNDPQKTLKTIPTSPTSFLILWGEDSEHILISSREGVGIWNTETEQQEISFDTAGRAVNAFDWQNDLVVGNPFDENDQFIQVWRASTGELLNQIIPTENVFSVTLSPDGGRIAYGDGEILQLIPSIAVSCPSSQTIASGNVTELINAINAANANPDASIIGLSAGTYTFTAVNNNVYNSLPRITSDITICSQDGATITRQTGAPQLRFFDVQPGGKLTLDNLNLNGASANNKPGGAVINNGILVVNNVTFTGNHAGTGAAVDNNSSGATATITDSTFQNNTANYGAALDNDANATMTVTNSTFTGNVAVHDGGAIRNHGVLSLIDSQILNNTASAGGSGIFSTGTTTHNSCISGNTASVTSVVHVGSNVQDFAGNYWGAADGPSGAGGGSGDSVNHNINFADFLTACPHD